MRISTTQFSLEPVAEDHRFWERVENLVQEAQREDSKLILFPEYFSLSWLVFKVGGETFRDRLEKANEILPEFQQKMTELARVYQIVIVAGTVPVVESGKILNRCLVFLPSGGILSQDKINMTRFENEEWKVTGGGRGLLCFKVQDFLCAITTCYDVEFPAITAMAAEQGVELLLVPSCTDDVHGYWRVRHCAQARTIENQCYVVMSSIVGGHPQWSEIEVHYGQGGVYTPCDVGMPEGGVAKLGLVNQEGVITEAIDRQELLRLRKNGTVLNLRDSKPI